MKRFLSLRSLIILVPLVLLIGSIVPIAIFAKSPRSEPHRPLLPTKVMTASDPGPGSLTITTDASCTDLSTAAVIGSGLDTNTTISGTAKVAPTDPTDTQEAIEGENLVLLETNGTVTKPIKVITIANGTTPFSFTPSMPNVKFIACIQGADGDELATLIYTATVTATNPNWAGYASVGSDNRPVTYTEVSASWKVPKATCTGTDSSSIFWVGLDGLKPTITIPILNIKLGPVEQDGTATNCTNGKPEYYAWYETFPLPQAKLDTKKYPVKPGDSFDAKVQFVGLNVFNNPQFLFTLHDATQKWGFSIKKGAIPIVGAPRTSAECIAEHPFSILAPLLTDFGTVSFSNCKAEGLPINTGPILVKLEMVNGKGKPLTTTEPLINGTDFKVKFVRSQLGKTQMQKKSEQFL
jgi:hypothetical protein